VTVTTDQVAEFIATATGLIAEVLGPPPAVVRFFDIKRSLADHRAGRPNPTFLDPDDPAAWEPLLGHHPAWVHCMTNVRADGSWAVGLDYSTSPASQGQPTIINR